MFSGGFRGVPGVPWNPPLGWTKYTKSIDDRPNGNPLPPFLWLNTMKAVVMAYP